VFEVLGNLGMMVLDALALVPGRRRFDFRETVASREGRFTLGVERRSGVPYLETRVRTSLGVGREHYRLSGDEYARFRDDHAAAAQFADECRAEAHDERRFIPRRPVRG
jgi:hypothetical protein